MKPVILSANVPRDNWCSKCVGRDFFLTLWLSSINTVCYKQYYNVLCYQISKYSVIFLVTMFVNSITENIENLLILIEFEKAFDVISREFISNILRWFNFCERIVEVVKSLQKGAFSEILQNGHLSDFISLQRGCRQGDPIPQYIFVLAYSCWGGIQRAQRLGWATAGVGSRGYPSLLMIAAYVLNTVIEIWGYVWKF